MADLENIIVKFLLLFSCLLGVFQLLNAKGECAHIMVGRGFTFCVILGVCSTLVLSIDLQWNAHILSISLLAAYLLLSAWRSIRAKNEDLQMFDAFISISSLVAVFWIWSSLSVPMLTNSWISTDIFLATLIFICFYDISRYWWLNYWLVHIRRSDHGGKMVMVCMCLAEIAWYNTRTL